MPSTKNTSVHDRTTQRDTKSDEGYHDTNATSQRWCPEHVQHANTTPTRFHVKNVSAFWLGGNASIPRRHYLPLRPGNMLGNGALRSQYWFYSSPWQKFYFKDTKTWIFVPSSRNKLADILATPLQWRSWIGAARPHRPRRAAERLSLKYNRSYLTHLSNCRRSPRKRMEGASGTKGGVELPGKFTN